MFRRGFYAIQELTRPRQKSLYFPTIFRSFSSTWRELPSNAAPSYKLRPYTLSSTSVNSTATLTVICCPIQRHSVAYLRTFNSLLPIRHYASSSKNSTNTVRYIVATTIVVLGLSYAAVPLYRLFCQASGYGGTVTKTDAGEKVEQMEPDRERSIVVR